MREKESLECVRMHIWALKTQKLPGPLSRPWTPAADCSLRSHNYASIRRQLSASEAGAPPLTKSWIRTWYLWSVSTSYQYTSLFPGDFSARLIMDTFILPHSNFYIKKSVTSRRSKFLGYKFDTKEIHRADAK